MKVAIRTLIFLGILITPFLNLYEILGFLSGTLVSQTEVLTHYYLKITKDFVMISIVILLFINHFNKKISVSYLGILSFFLTVILASVTNTIMNLNQDYLVYGLRLIYPAFILLFGINFFEEDIFDRRNSIILIIIFLIHLLSQSIQLFSGATWFGLIGAYSARNPGIFLIPNTGAFFSITCLFYFLYFDKYYRYKNYFLILILVILSSVSVILTGSGTGIIAFLFLLIIKFLPNRLLFSAFPISTFILVIVRPLLDFIRGDDYVEISGGTRVEIFSNLLENILKRTDLFSSSFGYFTNTAYLMGESDYIMDSTFAALLGNLGLLPFMIFSGMMIFLIFRSAMNHDRRKLSFLILVLLFSLTTIIFEAYPMNMLLAIMGSILYKKKKNIGVEEKYE